MDQASHLQPRAGREKKDAQRPVCLVAPGQGARAAFAARMSETQTDHPLDLLEERCATLATRVSQDELLFIDAVDMAYSAADWAGLVDRYGDDRVQAVLADPSVGGNEPKSRG